jgi:hypothetical protein
MARRIRSGTGLGPGICKKCWPWPSLMTTSRGIHGAGGIDFSGRRPILHAIFLIASYILNAYFLIDAIRFGNYLYANAQNDSA